MHENDRDSGDLVAEDPVTGAELCRMFNHAIHGQGAPQHVSTDHDPLFEAHQWMANLRILEIDEIKTVPHVPLSTHSWSA